MKVAVGRGLVEACARLLSVLYPPDFRRRHRRDFSDVAAHLFEQESQARPAWSAAMKTSAILMADTFAATPPMWLSAARGIRARGRSLFGGGWHDLRLALRSVRRRPGFSALVVGTLGLGIGASTAAFDALDRAILRPLPYRNPSELILLVLRVNPQGYMTSVPLTAVEEWRARSATLARVEVFRRMSAVRTTPTGSDQLDAIGVSGGLPAMLGFRPVLGRAIDIADAAPSAPAVIMLGEDFWRREYGADPAVVGRQLTIAGKPSEVVGIWPAGARLDYFTPPEVIRVLPAGNEYARGSWVQILARMRPGTTPDIAETELRAITTAEPSPSNLDYQPQVVTPAKLLLGEQFVTGLWLVFGGALVLLVGAIANASHLLLERSVERRYELGVRLALGSSRARLARLFCADAIVLAGLALALGAAVALGLERLISETEPRLYRAATGAGVLGRAFLFAAAASVGSTVMCALVPLLRHHRMHADVAVGGQPARVTHRRSLATAGLLVVQATLAVSLVFGATLLGRSLRALTRVDPGIAIEQLAELSISLPATRYPSPASRQLYFDRAMTAVSGIPGVTGAVRSGMPILLGSLMSGLPRLDGDPKTPAPPDANTVVGNVPPNYLDVMGMRLLDGRMFAAGETAVSVVSQGFARGYPERILGRQVFLPGADVPYTIVGVVNDVRYSQLANDRSVDQPAIYIPAAPSTSQFLRLIVRTTGDPEAVIADARRRLAEIDPAVPVLSPQTGADVIRQQTAQHRFVARLLSGLAVLGVLLAMSGVYGAVALSVSRRTREVGVRLALGAGPRGLVRLFVKSGVMPVAAGAVLGSIVVSLVAPYAEALLFRVSSRDPYSVAVGLASVLVVSLVAAYLPTRRLATIDPARTLREG